MKKGFTLIEVMVVIVILGILATIGVPKLFVSVAKAKAAEIPVAAGSYHSLQDAHLGEKTYLGSWKAIGYIPPGKDGSTGNFTYGGDCFDETPTNVIQKNSIGWKAVSKTSLSDCPANSVWAITLTAAEQNTVTYKQLTDQVDCISLTANWSFGGISGDCTPTKSESEVESESVSGQGGSIGGTASAGQAPSAGEGEAAQSGTVEAAKSAVAAAKAAFTMCNNKCANHKELKAAWESAKTSCEATYGKGACN